MGRKSLRNEGSLEIHKEGKLQFEKVRADDKLVNIY